MQQAVWKAVRSWSKRTLEKSGERVMNVQGDDDEDEDEDEDEAAAAEGASATG